MSRSDKARSAASDIAPQEKIDKKKDKESGSTGNEILAEISTGVAGSNWFSICWGYLPETELP